MDITKILIASPTKLELSAFSNVIKDSGLDYIISGVGPGATAMNLTRAMEKQRPCVTIIVGIGGGCPGADAGTKDVFLAESEAYGDLGRCTAGGVESVNIPFEGPEIVFPIREKWPAYLASGLHDVLAELKVKTAPMVTVSCASANFERAMEIGLRFGAAVENMEGAAAAQVCNRYGVPLLELRGVSNIAGDPERSKWVVEEALNKTVMALSGILTYLKKLSPSD